MEAIHVQLAHEARHVVVFVVQRQELACEVNLILYDECGTTLEESNQSMI